MNLRDRGSASDFRNRFMLYPHIVRHVRVLVLNGEHIGIMTAHT